MTEEKELYSNIGWLGSIIHRPKNTLRTNTMAVNKLEKLGYIEIVGNFVVATEKGRAYYNNIKRD